MGVQIPHAWEGAILSISTGIGDRLRAGKPPRFVTSHHSGQLSLLLSLLAGRKMSTGQSAVMLCGWGVQAGIVHSTCGS